MLNNLKELGFSITPSLHIRRIILRVKVILILQLIFCTRTGPWSLSLWLAIIILLLLMRILAEYLSQTISALSFLPPPKKGEDTEYNQYVQKSKNISMENAIEERAEKCSAYNKKLFTKGRQNTYQNAITTISNLMVFLEFVFDDAQSSEIPALITMLKVSQRFWWPQLSEIMLKRTKQKSNG